MNKYWKGVIVGFLAALCLVVVGAAFAGEPQDMLKGKLTVYVGQCAVDANGLIPDNVPTVKMVGCVVGKDPTDPDEILWVMFNDERGAYQVIRFNADTNLQEIKWKRGQVST